MKFGNILILKSLEYSVAQMKEMRKPSFQNNKILFGIFAHCKQSCTKRQYKFRNCIITQFFN